MKGLNNIFITCKIIKIEEICFDYYNKQKPYCIIWCKNMDINNNIFKVIIYDKVCSNYLCDLKCFETVFISGYMVNHNKEDIIIADEIFKLSY